MIRLIRSPNGEDCYWSRGNGWVFAALVRVLDVMPVDAPHREEYVKTFKEMAAALIGGTATGWLLECQPARSNPFWRERDYWNRLFYLWFCLGSQKRFAGKETLSTGGSPGLARLDHRQPA